MGISVFPVPSAGGTSSQLPTGGSSIWADGNLTSTTATITKAMPAGQYIVTSPSGITVTTNSGFTTTAIRNTPTTLNVTSAQTSVTLLPELIGTVWTTSANSTNTSGLTPANRAYASTIGRHVMLFDNNTQSHSYSADGFDNWIMGNMPSSTSWVYVAASPTRFVATVESSSNDTIAYSTDGINWSSSTMGVGVNKGNLIHSTVGDFFIIGRGDLSTTYYTSPTGVTWTARTMPSSGEWKYSVANNILFGTNASYNTNGATSANGTSWTAFTFPTDQNWYKVLYANGVYVATTRYGGPSATSTNGSTWTLRTSPTPPSGGSYGDTVSVGGVFLVVYTNTGSIAQSTDGINWRYQSSSPGVNVGNSYLSVAGTEVYGISNAPSPKRSTRTSAQPPASGQYFSISAGPVAPTY
jgi:hypothetical protein